MKDAQGQTVSLRIAGTSSSGEVAEFGASGTVITFRGFLAAYEEGRDTDDASDDDERRLPNLAEGDAVRPCSSSRRGTRRTRRRATRRRRSCARSRSSGSDARRPTRRSSARSSTAAMSSRRGRRSCRRSSPSPSSVCCEQHFGRLVDYDFTARMEDDLDRIAAGERGAGRVVAPLLLRRRRRRERVEGAGLRSRCDRRAGDQLDRARRGHRAAGRAATGRTSSATGSARTFPTTSFRTS